MNYRIILIIAMLFVWQSNAQHNISGQVINGETNEPIAFANVYLPELEKGSTTDVKGEFNIENTPTGDFKLICSFIGFETLSMNITIPIDTELVLRLNPSANEMEEIILSTPFHKLQSENVMKVERLDINEIRAAGALNLASGITEIAGVQSITTGSGIGKPVIRGLSANRVLVYAQGTRIENQQFGDEHGLGVSASGIESVEVIKGPASLLYGSDALGGVLYLNPERFAPQDQDVADLNFGYYGNTRGYGVNAGYKASGKAFSFLVRGSLAGNSDYNTDLFRVTNSRYNEQDLKTGVGFQKNKFKTELRYNLNSTEIGIPEEIGEQSTDRTPLAPFQEIENHLISSKTKIFLERSSFDLNFGYIFNDRKEFEGEEHEGRAPADEDAELALHMKLKTFNYDLKYNLPDVGKFETIVGIQGMFQDNSNFGEEILIPDAKLRDVGVLATTHIHFENIDLQLGARFDNRMVDVTNDFERSYNSFNLAGGLRTEVVEGLNTRINLASGFRAPNLAELASDGIHEGTNRYEVGNPDLENERNVQTDLAIEYQSEHVEIFANGFYNKVNDYIFVTPTGDFVEDNPVYNYVQDDAELYGGEFGFHLHPHPLDWLHFESSFDWVTGKQDNGDYLPLIPAKSLSNKFRVDFKNKWIREGYGFIKLRHVFDQENVNPLETRTGGFSLLSAGIGGQVEIGKVDFGFNIAGTNLTDKVYVDHLSRLKVDGIPNMGRNIILTINCSL